MILAAALTLIGSRPPQEVAYCALVNGRQNLYLINLDGTHSRQLTTGPAEDNDPAWSPDGSTVLFTRIPGHRKGEKRSDGHLWTIRRDGTRLTQLTSGPVYDGDARWSPDGKRITFDRQGRKSGFCELELATGKITRNRIRMWAPSISPDGRRIAYLRSVSNVDEDPHYDLWLTSSMTEPGRRLTHFRTVFSEPQWVASGRVILFKREMSPGPSSGDRLCTLAILNRKVRTIEKAHNNSISEPRWSPDGQRLCFIESIDTTPMTNASFGQLYVVSAVGTGKRRLTNHWGNDGSPQWTRDGKFILIQSDRGMRTEEGGVTGEPVSRLILVGAAGEARES